MKHDLLKRTDKDGNILPRVYLDYEKHIIQLLPQDIKNDSIFIQYLKVEEIVERFGELLTNEQIEILNDRRVE